jgi:Ca2+-binding RTX toxin-like protein
MRFGGRTLAVPLALSAALLAAPAAQAATVSVSVGTGEEGDAVAYTFSAAAGEANRVTVTVRPPAGRQRIVVFRDAGAPLVAGDGCKAGAAGAIVCRAALGDFANSVDVNAEDRDDTVNASAVDLRGFTVFVDGGAGSDVLTGSATLPNALFGDFVNSQVGDDRVSGGRRDDFLQGGPGDDVLDGRGGRDEATYRDERRRVRADLAAGSAVSAAGERDTLRSIERLEGGDGADVLLGNAADNVIQGLGGDDLLDGRGGNDLLQGTEGPHFTGPPDRDLLRGGPGRDTLLGDGGADSLFGGPGGDRLVGGRGVDVFDGGPDADRLRSADGRAETVRCGSGADRLLADAADRRAGCEAVRLR